MTQNNFVIKSTLELILIDDSIFMTIFFLLWGTEGKNLQLIKIHWKSFERIEKYFNQSLSLFRHSQKFKAVKFELEIYHIKFQEFSSIWFQF